MGTLALQPVTPQDFVDAVRADDPRWGERARSAMALERCRPGDVVLVGVPEDRGVEINRGRVGAAGGPQAWRAVFYRLPVGERAAGAWTFWDAGDITPGRDNAATHARLSEVVATIANRRALPLIIGGSHDNSFGGLSGMCRSGRSLGVLNIDAHLDLRPNEPDGGVGSGTPFRRLIDAGCINGRQLVEFGYQPHAVSAAHLAFAREQGVRLWSWFERGEEIAPSFLALLRDLARQYGRVAVSFDLDAMASSAAPGVSAPAPIGFSPAEAIAMMQLAGQESTLCYLDIMELNPTYDTDHRTARVAALLVWHFLTERIKHQK